MKKIRKRGGAAMIRSYGMDGYKNNCVRSASWWCLLLWQILILAEAFEQNRSGRGGGHLSIVKGTSWTFVAKRGPIISPA